MKKSMVVFAVMALISSSAFARSLMLADHVTVQPHGFDSLVRIDSYYNGVGAELIEYYTRAHLPRTQYPEGYRLEGKSLRASEFMLNGVRINADFDINPNLSSYNVQQRTLYLTGAVAEELFDVLRAAGVRPSVHPHTSSETILSGRSVSCTAFHVIPATRFNCVLQLRAN